LAPFDIPQKVILFIGFFNIIKGLLILSQTNSLNYHIKLLAVTVHAATEPAQSVPVPELVVGICDKWKHPNIVAHWYDFPSIFGTMDAHFEYSGYLFGFIDKDLLLVCNYTRFLVM
jgi:hypothetical protein